MPHGPGLGCALQTRPVFRQSQTKPLLLFNTSFEQKRGFVRFCLLRPRRPRPRPGGFGALCAARPLPRSWCVPGASPVVARRGSGRWRRLGLCLSTAGRCRAASSPAAPRPSPSSAGRVLGLAVRPVRPPLRSASLRSRRGLAPDGGALGAATPYRAPSPAPRPPRAADRRLSFRSKSWSLIA